MPLPASVRRNPTTVGHALAKAIPPNWLFIFHTGCFSGDMERLKIALRHYALVRLMGDRFAVTG